MSLPAHVAQERQKLDEAVHRKTRRDTAVLVSAEERGSETFDQQVPWPTLAPEALYGLAGDIVRTVEPQTESDPVALLIQILAAYGNVIGQTS